MNPGTDVPLSAERRACDAIRECWSAIPDAGIILGTGLSSLADHVDIDAVLPFADIPGFPCTTALGHRGRLICGRLVDRPVVLMDGRCHLYEGYPPQQLMLPVQVFARMGATRMIISNAAGGLNPRYRAGEIMVLEDHLDLTWSLAVSGKPGPSPDRPHRLQDRYYDCRAIARSLATARRHDIPAHQGVYAALSGPNYETRAEYRMLRRLGADAVGMSTVPEAVAAAQCNMRVLALSVITNVATPDYPQKVSGQQVVADARRAEDRLRTLVAELVTGDW